MLRKKSFQTFQIFWINSFFTNPPGRDLQLGGFVIMFFGIEKIQQNDIEICFLWYYNGFVIKQKPKNERSF